MVMHYPASNISRLVCQSGVIICVGQATAQILPKHTEAYVHVCTASTVESALAQSAAEFDDTGGGA
jgi:uroporphyrinogen-III synthase